MILSIYISIFVIGWIQLKRLNSAYPCNHLNIFNAHNTTPLHLGIYYTWGIPSSEECQMFLVRSKKRYLNMILLSKLNIDKSLCLSLCLSFYLWFFDKIQMSQIRDLNNEFNSYSVEVLDYINGSHSSTSRIKKDDEKISKFL